MSDWRGAAQKLRRVDDPPDKVAIADCDVGPGIFKNGATFGWKAALGSAALSYSEQANAAASPSFIRKILSPILWDGASIIRATAEGAAIVKQDHRIYQVAEQAGAREYRDV
uniref:hypothetical protein n=1 Tax=unclassified Variovorax TaxID=663243 RepID=UPI0010524DDF